MSKTKKLSQYNGSAWSTPIDIGADAANVDYPTTTQGVTKNLTEVIGNVATGDSPLQTQISTKLSSTGAIDNTVLNQGPDTTTYPVTGTNVSDGSLAVTANNSSRSLWSKFNAFRARLINRIATFVDADMSDTSDVTIADTIDADTLDGTLGSTIKRDIQNNTAAIAELNDSLVQLLYPIGSIFLSTVDVNPSTYFGGTWEVFGAADTYLRLGGNGSGGSNTVKLAANQIPTLTTGNQSANHTHTVNGGSHSHTITTNTSGDIIFTKSGKVTSGGGSTVPMDWGGGLKTNPEGGHTHTVGNNTANHTHTYTNNSQKNVSIQPKYVQTYAWKRTA